MSRPTPVLRAAGSHLYPGATGTAAGLGAEAEGPCLVELADGAAAPGTLEAGPDGLVLTTAPYTTARGTVIRAKRWLIEVMPGAAEGRFRVIGRAG